MWESDDIKRWVFGVFLYGMCVYCVFIEFLVEIVIMCVYCGEIRWVGDKFGVWCVGDCVVFVFILGWCGLVMCVGD